MRRLLAEDAMSATRSIASVLLITAGLLGGAALQVSALQVAAPEGADPLAEEEPGAIGRTPPRLAFVDGQVSFWRPGADEWVAARLNTALAAGDELYTGSPGNLELQIGARAYGRAWARTHVGVASLEPDFVQLRLTTGFLSLDLRRLDPGHTVELDTPNAAFTIEHPGYYRIDVTGGHTSFITRRGGRAMVTLPDGTTAAVAASEQLVVEGTEHPRMFTYVVPELDAWDRWNYARTDALIDSLSSRYVPPGVYGVDDLDYHGAWRVVETYGAVWVPTGVPVGWVPYSVGSWQWDFFFGWTWVDAAPWGWAPYHYGRWVLLSGVWAWAPGPVVVRPVYAPALVAFLGPRVGVSIGVAGPAVGWVALGWGEPVIPWWGSAGFIGVPRWLGWGGPRIVNNVVIPRTTIVHAHDVKTYRHADVRHAVTVVPRDRFGRGPVPSTRIAVDPGHLEPIRGKPDIAPARRSLVPDTVRGVRPPDDAIRRPVVATRPPVDPAPRLEEQGIAGTRKTPAVPPRLVTPPARTGRPGATPRPPFGESTVERSRPAPPPSPGRAQPPTGTTRAPSSRAPAVQKPGAAQPSPRATPPATTPPAKAPAPKVQAPEAQRPAPPRLEPRATPPAPRAQTPAPRSRALPGEPANRVFPGQSGAAPGERR
jgi:hypothetical protein